MIVEEKRVYGVRLYTLLLIACFTCFCGWWIENVFCLLAGGVMDARHQLFPFLLGYGVAFLGLFCIFGTFREPRIFGKRFKGLRGKLIFLLTTFLSIMTAELLVGKSFEWLWGIRGWNYSGIPLHITRYTSVPTTAGFVFGYTMYSLTLKYLCNFVDRFSKEKIKICALFWVGIIIADWCLMISHPIARGELPVYWRIYF